MDNKLFSLAKEVIQKLEIHGYQAYIVGGAVRDSLLQRSVGDIDIATSAFPDEVQNIFPKVIPTGIQHGTVMVRYQSVSFEVTTFRTESAYSDSRRPDQVKFVSNLIEDLARRDFTMNAIAMDHSKCLIDPFAGQQDIDNKLIRTVGDANDRFREDALRMMRAIRFQSQLGFEIDRSALVSIEKNSPLMRNISIERIATEWEKMIKGDHFHIAKQTLIETGLYRFLPIISNHQVVKILKNTMISFPSFSAFIAYMHIKVNDILISDWTQQWKLSNQLKKESKLLVHLLQDYHKEEIAWVVYNLPEQLMEDFYLVLILCTDTSFSLSQLKMIKRSLPIKNRNKLIINGSDIVAFFPEREKGAWIHELLLRIEKAVVTGRLENSKKAIREWLHDDQ
ncbi:tRNA nucleotidyltransferase [Gracilibacillus boraciitolerans JCM 21714]|uniref:CCA-adding enzyme n=1 Tax=Gracilibacillus boraciitolerans JCM 21714 TaxID=1298598 RepID=W4VDA7_9BACI|nr:CCA tRNA nucleotidyltransferase [Gracilibacillus boraciitolerans]GAE91390.1 tRNA nucleotidyltransferase [Gracilibacillus boraciitolerans JCM 21714]